MTLKPVSDSKTIWSWVFFDFANSAYTTLVLTFIYSTYFVKAIAPDEITGTALWSRGVTITAVAVALLSPFLGAVADQGNLRKRFLLISTVVAVMATFALNFVMPGQVMPALIFFVISNIAFEFTMVFYNAFLPDIAPEDGIGKISGIGWGVGYLGGLLALVVALVGFVSPQTPWFGLSKETGANIRATNLLVAVWFTLFAIPFFLFVRQKSEARVESILKTTRKGLTDVAATFRELKTYRQIALLLFARLIYNDGLVTIFAFGGIYAAGTFGFSFDQIIIFGIGINVAAGLGAFIMGYADDRFGGKKAIQISNIALACATLLAVTATNKPMFWVAGMLIGFFSGPNQAASRSLLARFVPREKENQFFGFFAFSGKLTAFLGPLLLGVLTQTFESQRVGVASIIVFFVVGGAILHFVDEKEGLRLSKK